MSKRREGEAVERREVVVWSLKWGGGIVNATISLTLPLKIFSKDLEISKDFTRFQDIEDFKRLQDFEEFKIFQDFENYKRFQDFQDFKSLKIS